MTPEGKIKDMCKKLFKSKGVWYFMPVSNGLGRHGVPDFCCIYRGYALYVETKAHGKKPTALQLVCKSEIEAAGGAWFLVDGEESLLAVKYWLDERSDK